ncbi:MAG: protein kinase [Dysosmobacter sp.]
MSQIIASTYEILRQIGSGGGGVVYLGRHLRLGKFVVLKADRRTLSARPETLRREVDTLKNLSHTYIPQVYDFVVEDGVVYTVMDYIEGESLDKPLKRGERFSQAQVIEWACQLLEALHYLHTFPPHGILHSDIKPSNIMRTPQNDIRLIDFNIALALGETGAVRVGYSQGYASPEHYGSEESPSWQPLEQTEVMEDPNSSQFRTVPMREPEAFSASSGRSRRGVLLDVRSDIYSLGATLYHLLTGQRPARDACQVRPITDWDGISPAVAAIVAKAMDPDPDRRWQTAAEMLSAFEHLHDSDPRTKRHRRRCVAVAAVLSLVFLAGGFTAFVGLKQMERTQNAYALAEYSADALRRGDVSGAVAYALEALPENRGLFDPPYTAQARRALTNALGVYDLSDGFKSHQLLSLPSEPIKAVLSPEGTRAAVLTAGLVTVFDTGSGETLAELPAEKSALSDMVFVDDDTLLYAGEGALRCYDLAAGRELWSGKAATSIALSADGSAAAAVYRDENVAAVYNTAGGQALRAVTFHDKRQSVLPNDVFADPEDNLFALDAHGRWLAASFSDGSLRVFDLEDSENDLELYDSSDYTHFEGGFFGQYFAFSATNAEESVFAVIDLEAMEQTGGFMARRPFHVQADESGIYVCTDNILVRLDPVTGDQTEVAYTDADITAFARSRDHTLTATADGAFTFFDSGARSLQSGTDGSPRDFVQVAGSFALTASRDTPALRVMKLEDHPDVQLFAYDPSYVHDEARISADGKTVMLFRYDAFRLCAMDGTVLADVAIPDAEQVYDQQYRRDGNGSCLEVFYNDGTVRAWSAGDGSLLRETAGEKPDGTLDEEFLTDRYRVTSPLHGTPAVYDRKTGALVRELEPDAYLTYVTQVGDGMVTEYISAQGQRYGLLLDENCETLADLPGLCDILADGTLVFDDMRGNLRQSRIYSMQELLALANQ